MKQIILSFAAAMMLAGAAQAQTTAVVPSNGTGAPESPYEIASLANLQWLSETPAEWGNAFIQIADIDASETATWDSGAGFSPIGNSSTPFTGTYDGGGHTITELYISRASTDYVGLFGRIDGSAKVENLGLVGGSVSGQQYVGDVVGYNNGTVSNCYATGEVSGGYDVGGVVGNNYHNGSMSNCYATGDVSGAYQVGGVVGKNYGTISNCYSTGNVSGTGNVGGMVGYNESVVSNCYATGNVSGSTIGGVVGNNNGGIIIASFALQQEALPEVGFGSSDGASLVSESVLKSLTTFTSAGWGINSAGDAAWRIVNGLCYPTLAWQQEDGSACLPYTIATLADLKKLSETPAMWDKHFIQTADIDASETSTWDSNKGFSPIGNSSTRFTGTYNGQGHTITGLTINRPSQDYVGLFGYISGSNAIVENVGLVGGSIKGNGSVGGVSGRNYNSVNNCYSTGTISGNNNVGGVVGLNGENSSISNCYAIGNVTGNGAIGGVVGGNHSGGKVNDCYATGNVSGKSNVGGVAGYNEGPGAIVSNCYATGNVSGTTTYIGGVLGYNNFTAIVSYCSSTGTVSGGNYVGGVLGYNYGATITASFALNQNDGKSAVGGDNNSGTITNVLLVSAEEMKSLAYFETATWDISSTGSASTIWKIDDGLCYPYLAWQPSLSNPAATVNGISASYTYTGTAIEPVLASVVYNGKTLSSATDYTVSYGANTTVAQGGSVVVAGKGV
jgi:hypothetical protein